MLYHPNLTDHSDLMENHLLCSKFFYSIIFPFWFISSPGHKPCELLSWLGVRRPSVSFSHLNLLPGYKFESWPPKDHSCHVCYKLTYWFKRRLLNIFSIGSYVKTKSSHGGHLEFPKLVSQFKASNFQNYIQWPRPPSKIAALSGHSFNIHVGPYGKYV
jgi:hypothetical protein